MLVLTVNKNWNQNKNLKPKNYKIKKVIFEMRFINDYYIPFTIHKLYMFELLFFGFGDKTGQALVAQAAQKMLVPLIFYRFLNENVKMAAI